MRHIGKQTWVGGNEAARRGLEGREGAGGEGCGAQEDLMDNSTTQQRQSFHLKMVPGLSQKVRAQSTNTLH